MEKEIGDHMPFNVVQSDPVNTLALAQVFPAGEQRVQLEPSQLFFDPFDSGQSLDTTNRWNAAVSGGGGTAAAQSSGNLTLGTGTTANGYSYLTSQPAFRSSTPGWLRFAFNVQFEAAPLVNTFRAWGAANPQAVPTAVNPISDGAVFELATNQKLYACIYQGGVRTVVADLSAKILNVIAGTPAQQVDGTTHNYQIFYRPTNSYWYIDGVLVATSSLTQSALNVDTLAMCYMAVAGSVAPVSSGVLTSNACSISDTAGNNTTISDGIFAFRRATVKSAATAPATTDTALVVSMAPSQAGKTLVMKSGTLASSANTADQVILTYTVTAGKTFYLQYFDFTVRLTTMANTATAFGTLSLESPAGTKLYTADLSGQGVFDGGWGGQMLSEAIPIAASTVIRVVCTPSAATAFTWGANFGGYER